jgi:hypothetical protein
MLPCDKCTNTPQLLQSFSALSQRLHAPATGNLWLPTDPINVKKNRRIHLALNLREQHFCNSSILTKPKSIQCSSGTVLLFKIVKHFKTLNQITMKKLFTLSTTFLLAVILLGSCRKADVIVTNDENYWLNQEAGEVVYSDPSCNYWVVETYNGYTVIQSSSVNQPYEGELIYGNFSNRGTRNMYNFQGRFVFTGTVIEYWLSYNEALDVLDYYCPIYGKAGETTRVLKQSTKIKKK